MKRKNYKDKCMEVFKNHPNKWLPVHYFIGDRMGINGYVFLSHRCPARVSELFDERGDIDRRKHVGKAGVWYYEYIFLIK